MVAKVDGVAWDLDRPLEKSCSLALIKFTDEEGQAVFWHSSAHILGEAMERVYGAHLCYGPPIDGGFYYDMWSDDQKVSSILKQDYHGFQSSPKGVKAATCIVYIILI